MSKLQWHIEIVRVLDKSYREHYVHAMTCEGLAVHRAYDRKYLWHITHIASGAYITYCDNYKEAKERATRLLSLEGMWLGTAEDIDRAVKQEGRHRQIIKEICRLTKEPTYANII